MDSVSNASKRPVPSNDSILHTWQVIYNQKCCNDESDAVETTAALSRAVTHVMVNSPHSSFVHGWPRQKKTFPKYLAALLTLRGGGGAKSEKRKRKKGEGKRSNNNRHVDDKRNYYNSYKNR